MTITTSILYSRLASRLAFTAWNCVFRHCVDTNETFAYLERLSERLFLIERKHTPIRCTALSRHTFV